MKNDHLRKISVFAAEGCFVPTISAECVMDAAITPEARAAAQELLIGSPAKLIELMTSYGLRLDYSCTTGRDHNGRSMAKHAISYLAAGDLSEEDVLRVVSVMVERSLIAVENAINAGARFGIIRQQPRLDFRRTWVGTDKANAVLTETKIVLSIRWGLYDNSFEQINMTTL